MPENSVDAILTDLPYGTTACAWDTVIPFDAMWEAVKHVLKSDGAFVTTARQPFTSLLINSNIKWFRYEWIWEKSRGVNFLSGKTQPLRKHENIIVFSENQHVYNYQKRCIATATQARNNRNDHTIIKKIGNGLIQTKLSHHNYSGKIEGFPISIIYFDTESNNQFKKPVKHPTQKPVALYKYLVQTYTNPGDTVLDMCMGSGTSGVACIELGRDFIGCETERKYFEIAEKRIEDAAKQGLLPLPHNNAHEAEQNPPRQVSWLN